MSTLNDVGKSENLKSKIKRISLDVIKGRKIKYPEEKRLLY